MADVIWPAGLPQEALLAGTAHLLGPQTLRSTVDVGVAKVHARSTSAVDRFPISLNLTPAQYSLFVTFFRDSLRGGARAFAWKHPLTGNPADFRFLGEPRFEPSAPRNSAARVIRVTFEMELLPGTEVTDPFVPEAPANRAGGGGGLGGEGLPSAGEAGYIFDELEESLLGNVTLGIIPFEADAAPAEVLIFILDGAGAGPESLSEEFGESSDVITGAIPLAQSEPQLPFNATIPSED